MTIQPYQLEPEYSSSEEAEGSGFRGGRGFASSIFEH